MSLMSKKSLSRVYNVFYELFLRRASAKVGTGIVLAITALVVLGPFFMRFGPYQQTLAIDSPPSLVHPFGTDYLGRDILSQVVYGGAPSLLIGFLSSVGGAIIGLVAGLFAGYYPRLEGILTGTSDVILTFSPLPLLVLIGMLFPNIGILVYSAIFTILLWPIVTRAIRSQVLSVKNRPFVDAARTSGMSDSSIIFKIILPEVGAIAFAYFVLSMAIAVVLIVSLEFLGVGNPDVVSWGSTLYWAQQFAFYRGAWWWVLAPGLCVTLVAVGFALIGFSFETAFNPNVGQ